MQSEKLHYETPAKMTCSPSPIPPYDNPLERPPSPLKFPLPIPPQSPLKSKSFLLHQDSRNASVRHRLRISKLLSKESFRERKFPPDGEDDLRNEIRVLSPSLVNSQVLSKTRPLSPADDATAEAGIGVLPTQRRKQDENDATGLKLNRREQSGRRKQEVKNGKGSNEDFESLEGKETQKETNKKGRGRRRPRLFKLKFHHQALPPEYLDHYEASLRQERLGLNFDPKDVRETLDTPADPTPKGLQSGLRNSNKSKTGRVPRSARPITIHEAGGTTEALLRDLLLSNPQIQQAALQQAAIARAQSVPSIVLSSVGQNPRMQFPPPLPPQSPDDKTFGDDQSSYASDMSVDECPKRNRKSKRNGVSRYMGRVLGAVGMATAGGTLEKSSSQMTVDRTPTPTLTTQYLNFEKESLSRSRSYTSLVQDTYDQSEPLNLCVRDRNLNYPTTPIPQEDYQTTIKAEPCSIVGDENKIPEVRREFEECTPKTPGSPPEYPTWSFGGSCFAGAPPHWLHDYRLKTEDGLSSGQSTPSLCSQSSHLTCLSPPTWPHFSPPPHSPSPVPPLSPLHSSANPRHIQALLKDSLHHRLEEARERLTPRESLTNSPNRSNIPTTYQSARESKTGARRKRSALFIPPADPSTEVSICKFKFTGGANPVLEEKKMVSVDAGGTLRYFSGGDRVMSREHRHTAPNIRLSGKILENLSKCEKDVKKIRLESDTEDTCSLQGASCSSATTSPTATLEHGTQSPLHFPAPIEDSPKRKRRSKKSSVREKLEQTLREKGLLIQTQQVESAEGATYCKFRQLRKITRYLFRSWKDYLPGQMHEGMPGDIPMPNQRPPSGYCRRSSTPHEPTLNNQMQYSSPH